MRIKDIRQMTLRRLIAKNRIPSQEEIISLLKAEGLVATQATLSRDLKELRVVKMHNSDGGYFYALPSASANSAPAPHDTEHTLSGIMSVEASGSFIVIKTRPGYANMVGSVIDASFAQSIMGTIAGDDTLLVILRKEADMAETMEGLEGVLPGISARVI